MKTKIRVLAVPLGAKAQVLEIDNSLPVIQGFVEGCFTVASLDDGSVLVCNEEAIPLGLPDNREVPGPGMIKGSFFICSLKDGDFADIQNAGKYLPLLNRGD